MTEDEWLVCQEPYPMLEFLRGKTSERMLRLFAAACCRRIWPLLEDERSRRAVEVLERYADERASVDELTEAARAAHAASEELGDSDNRHAARAVANAVFADTPDVAVDEDEDGDDAPVDIVSNAKDAAFAAAFATAYAAHGEEEEADDACYSTTKGEEAIQAALVRCLAGDPFRPSRPLTDDLQLTPGTINLAREIYREREFDSMPRLGAALEQAGCTAPEVLSHCGRPGSHARGCWVVDSILGKSMTGD